jgi:hypothetical protein
MFLDRARLLLLLSLLFCRLISCMCHFVAVPCAVYGARGIGRFKGLKSTPPPHFILLSLLSFSKGYWKWQSNSIPNLSCSVQQVKRIEQVTLAVTYYSRIHGVPE